MAPNCLNLTRTPQFRIYALALVLGVYFVVQLVVSHFTHSLTLLADAYHSLHTIMSLAGFIIAIKMSRERSIKNTFGWARIEVLGMLISTLALAALSFSVVVEAAQTLFHVSHSDAMHHPLVVLGLGVAGVALNVACFLTIGGFSSTHSLVNVSPGAIGVNVTIPEDDPKAAEALLPKTKPTLNKTDTADNPMISNVDEQKLRRHVLLTFFGNVLCSFFVVVASIAVYMVEKDGPESQVAEQVVGNSTTEPTEAHGSTAARYIDPVVSIVSVCLLMVSIYPYFKESGMILLQTVPSYIDIPELKKKLIREFPTIENIHEVHVWRFTRSKAIATAHIRFNSTDDYSTTYESINQFFQKEGITLSTIQPEFEGSPGFTASDSSECILRCRKDCESRMCCTETHTSPTSVVVSRNKKVYDDGHGHSHGHSHSHNHDHGHSQNHGHSDSHSQDHGHSHSQDHGHSHSQDHDHNHSHGKQITEESITLHSSQQTAAAHDNQDEDNKTKTGEHESEVYI